MHEEEGEKVQRLPCDLLRPQAPHRQVPVLQVRVTGGQQRSEEVIRGHCLRSIPIYPKVVRQLVS